jgi:hypothetical protein
MKEIKYRKIKRALKYTYLKPDDESSKRLFNKLCIKQSIDFKEHRFVTKFRIVLAAVITLVCLLNINSVNPRYLNRYNNENIIALGKLITDTSLWEKLIPGMED